MSGPGSVKSDSPTIAAASSSTVKHADPIELAWQKAQKYALDHYTQDQLAGISSASSAENVLQHLQLLQSKTNKKPIVRFYEKFRAFLDRIAQYEEVLKIYSNSHMAVAILWGSINLLLVVSHRVLSYLDRFANILNEFSDHLPRMQRYAGLFADNARLGDMLAVIYSDLMDFCILTTTFFCKKSLSMLKRIIWSDFEAHSTRIIVKLSKHREIFDLEANACHAIESKAARNQQSSHRDLLECLEVVKWLNPADTEDHFDRLQRLRVDCTGMWFLATPEYKLWADGAQKLLWVNGIPGSGKSILCSSLVAYLHSNQPGSQVAYFFCDEGNSTKRTAAGILRSLIAQLVARNLDFVQLAREIIIKSGQETATSFSRLMSLFKSMIERSSSATYVIIDGVDECVDGAQSGLLQKLTELAATQPLHLAIFSRREPWLCSLLSAWPFVEITPRAIEQDIILYLRNAVQKPPLSRFSNEILTRRITQVLLEKADGQFLWTRLMIEMLEKATFASEIDQILSDVPLGLSQLYSRILEKLLGQPSRRQDAAQLLLSWLACAERHLTMAELATALAVRPGATEIDSDDRVLDLRGFVEDVCGSLVRVSEPTKDRSEAVVSFVHYTVKEYLLASEELCYSKSTPVVKFRVDKCETNQHLASTCITYLNFDEFIKVSGETEVAKTANSPSQDLLDYAAMYWVQHLVQSGPPSIDLLRRLYLFLQSDQLLGYIERTVVVNNAGFSISNLLVSQSLLNDWIRQCDAGDPRLSMVSECFRVRLEEAIQSRGKLLGDDHSETTEAKFQLAELLHYRGQWARSATLHREVMEARIRTIGEQHRNTSSSMFCLATVLTRMGSHNESRDLHERALQQRKEILGNNDPDTLRSEDGLAKTMKEQGLLEEAEAMSRATLVKKNRVFGKNSLDAALTMDGLAATLKDTGLRHNKTGNNALAMQAFWECETISRNGLAIREVQLGVDNPQTITCVNMLGIVLRHLKRPEESEQYHRRALRTRRKILGPNNPHTQKSMRNLGSVLRDQGKFGEAQEIEQMFRASQVRDSALLEREGGASKFEEGVH